MALGVWSGRKRHRAWPRRHHRFPFVRSCRVTRKGEPLLIPYCNLRPSPSSTSSICYRTRKLMNTHTNTACDLTFLLVHTREAPNNTRARRHTMITHWPVSQQLVTVIESWWSPRTSILRHLAIANLAWIIGTCMHLDRRSPWISRLLLMIITAAAARYMTEHALTSSSLNMLLTGSAPRWGSGRWPCLSPL